MYCLKKKKKKVSVTFTDLLYGVLLPEYTPGEKHHPGEGETFQESHFTSQCIPLIVLLCKSVINRSYLF